MQQNKKNKKIKMKKIGKEIEINIEIMTGKIKINIEIMKKIKQEKKKKKKEEIASKINKNMTMGNIKIKMIKKIT